MSKFIKTYNIMTNHLKQKYYPIEFLNDITKFIRNDLKKEREINTIYKYRYFKNYLFNNDEDKLTIAYLKKILSNEYYIHQIDNNLSITELLNKFSNVFSNEFRFNLDFLPYFVLFLKKTNYEIYINFINIFSFIVLDFETIFNLIDYNYLKKLYSNEYELNVCQKIIFDYLISTKDLEEAEEISRLGIVLFYMLSINNINICFDKKVNKLDFPINVYQFFDKSNFKCYIYRHNLPGIKKLTLEELGFALKVTKERCRQIEAKFNVKIENLVNAHKVKIDKYVYNIFNEVIQENDYPYITILNLCKHLKQLDLSDNEIIFILCIIEDGYFENIKYDKYYNLFYDPRIFNINEFINYIMDSYGELINIMDYKMNCDFLTKCILKEYYSEFGNSLVKNGISISKIYSLAIKKYFPNGIELNQNSFSKDGIKLINILKNEFGFDNNESPRAFLTKIISQGYVSIDKGLFNHIDLIDKINPILLDKIKLYINDNGPIILYKTIYHAFIDELNNDKIFNYYHLKSLLDYQLRNENYKFKRDFISLFNNDETFYEYVVELINNTNGAFSLDDIYSKFPHISLPVVLNIISQNPNVIYLGNNIYYNTNLININKDIKQLIFNKINCLFEELDSDVISSDKLFNRIILDNIEIFEQFPVIDDSFKFYSLVQYIFRDQFYFKRPLISKKKDNKLSIDYVIKQYVEKLEWFDRDIVFNFTSKMELRTVADYYKFMESESCNFVQIDMGKMVKKNILQLSNKFLNDFNRELNYQITSFGNIDTATFKGYNILPHCQIQWNKYFIIGIINSYLKENFEIINTTNSYDTTDFIIKRRVNYE